MRVGVHVSLSEHKKSEGSIQEKQKKNKEKGEERDLSVEKLRILSPFPHAFGLCASVFGEQNFSRKARDEEGTAV